MLGFYLQDRAVLEVVGAGPPLQGAEGHVAAGERGEVTELVRADRLRLVIARDHVPIRVPAGESPQKGTLKSGLQS